MPALRSLLFAGVAVLALLGGADVGARADRVADIAPIGEIARAQLPPEAYRVLALMRAGGPYDDVKDNTIFGNREGLLPPRRRDYYYTDDHYRSFRRIGGVNP